MHAAQISTTSALGAFLAVIAGHPLLERLFFASIELAVLAVLVFAAIRVGRLRSARLASILWLLVLAKPLVSLAIGSPIPLVRMRIPAVAVAVPTLQRDLEPIKPQPVETPKPDDSQPFADDMSVTPIESDMQRQPPVEVHPAPATPEMTTPEPITRDPIVAEPPPVLGPQPGPVAANLPTIVLAVWLGGAVLFALRSLIDRIRVRRLVRGARLPDEALSARSNAVAAQSKLKRAVRVRVTTELEGPALVGSFFPTVLIPEWLAADPNPGRLDWALRHELMHWKLRDPLAGLVREFAQMLFYFHPAAWWAGHRWEVAAEQACDRAIVTNAADSADYAEQLYGILIGMQGRLRARIGNGLFATRTQIGQRIAALLNGPLTPRAHLSVLALIGVTVVACITLSIGGAFADKNAEHAESDKSDQAQPVAEQIAAIPNDAPSAVPSAPSVPPQTLETPVKNAPYVYAGTIVDDAGKPVVGAKITLDHAWSSLPSEGLAPLAVSDTAGHFQFSVPKRGATDDWAKSWSIDAMLLATKDGYGLAGGPAVQFETTGRLAAEQQQRTGDAPKPGTHVLNLAPDDVPIRGRLLDTEGRPVADATVQVINVWQGRDGSLLNWEKNAKTASNSFLVQKTLRPLTDTTSEVRPPVALPVRTDADGRFNLHGIGRDRVADVLVRAPRLETTLLHVRSRRGDAIKGLGQGNVYYPCEFTRVLGPTTSVEGQIVDAKSEQAVTGVQVRRRADPPSGWVPGPYRTVRTNADGRYRLDGLPIGGNVLEIVPPGGSPLIPQWFAFRTRFSPAPAIANVTLAHGTRVRGRATDVRTGRPVHGVVDYFVFRNNPALAGVVDPKRPGNLLDLRNPTDENGVFEIAVLPGPGIVAFRADRQDEFPLGQGADRINGGKWEETRGTTMFETAPMECGSEFYNLLTPVAPAPGTESLELNLTLRSIVTVAGKVLSPEGKTLRDYSMFDDCSLFDDYRIAASKRGWHRERDESFEVKVYSPTDRHRLMFFQRALNLAGYYELTGEPAGRLEITLQAAGTIVGRLVDGHGKPLPDVALVIATHNGHAKDVRAASDANTNAIDQKQISTDEQGRFAVRGVIPGLSYSAETIGSIEDSQHHTLPAGAIFNRVIAAVGETKNLGDIQIGRPVQQTNSQQPTDDNASYVYAGTVVDDKGKPAAGVKIYLDYWRASLPPGGPPILTVSDAQGRFQFSRRRSDFADAWTRTPIWTAAMVVGTKEGYGPAGGRSLYFETTGKLAREAAEQTKRPQEKGDNVLRLASDDVPIRGRILDIEGRPVVGALVRAVNIWQPPDGNLDSWEATAKKSGTDHWELLRALRPITFSQALIGERPSAAPTVHTDAAGWFTLKGVGRERLVDLIVSGRNIETTLLHVRSRRGEVIKRDVRSPLARQFDRSDAYYPCEFTVARGPSVVVAGRVTDDKSRRPIAGVQIWAERIAGKPATGSLPPQYLATTTDAEGRYQLAGLPLGKSQLTVVPPRGSRYLLGGFEVTTRMSGQPQVADVGLTAGVLVRGRVTDERTGRSLAGNLRYFAFRSNPYLEKAGSFPNASEMSQQARFQFDETGVFEIPVLPGPGILAFRASDYHAFPFGVGADLIDGPKDGTPGASYFLTAPTYCSPGQFHLLTSINPQRREESITLNLSLRSGLTVKGKVYGPDRTALSDYYIFSDGHAPMWTLNAGQMFEVKGYDPKDRRLLMFYHAASNLVGHYELTGPAPNHLEIALQPGATITGRVVDSAGNPLEGLSIEDAPKPENPPMNLSSAALRGVLLNNYLKVPGQRAVTDQQGRFELVGIVPGTKYSAVARHSREPFGQYPVPIFTDVTTTAGEKKDLGNLALNSPNANAAAESVKKAKEPTAEVIEVHGRVLLPDGKPASGARVLALRHYWRPVAKRPPLDKTTAGADGKFTLRIPKLPVGSVGGATSIAAELSGFGTQWEFRTPRDDTSKEVVLKLVDEMPIHGRIVDLEGKPVRGARVAVLWQQSPRPDFGAWLEALKSGSQAAFGRMPAEFEGYDEQGQPPTVTDGDGRFALRGSGADRLVHLAVRGESIAYAELDVVTRPIKPFARKVWSGTAEVFGADFTYLALPTRPIVGTVRDAASGAPLSGVRIELGYRGAIAAETDSAGKYRLIGAPKGPGRPRVNELVAVPMEDQPYFRSARVPAPDAAGLGPVTLDFELTRGIWISGRVTDKATGGPAIARVFYVPAAANPNAAKFAKFDPDGAIAPARTTKADGSFRHLAIPGPGIVWAWGIRQMYGSALQGSKTVEPAERHAYSQLQARHFGTVNALHVLDAIPGSEIVGCDLVLDPGGVIPLSIVDPAGKPVSDCIYVYQTAGEAMTWGAVAPFEMGGMEPNESRGVLFRSAKPNLGKVQVLHYDEKAASRSVTVKLEPYGTVKGRLLDEEGMPLKFVNVDVVARGDNYVLPPWRNGVESQADGRFAVSNVAAGAEYYEVGVEGFDEPIAKKLAVSSGQTIDLGDIRRKRKDNAVSSSKPDQPVKAAPPSKKAALAAVSVIHARVPIAGKTIDLGGIKVKQENLSGTTSLVSQPRLASVDLPTRVKLSPSRR